MKNNLIYKVAFGLLICFGLLATTSNDADDTAETCTCGTLIGIQFGPDVPGDNKLVTGQTQADCFAWWEFVALNWPVSGGQFGEPGDTGPVQWETYMTREVLMTPDGSPPPAWGSGETVPSHKKEILNDHPAGKKVLLHSSKFNSGVQIIDETGQAFPSDGSPNWLGAQNGTNVWYEVLVNEDEYNYIVENGFYNANTQYEYTSAGNRIDLPSGDANQEGAMEIKASWLEVTDPENSAKWNKYKLSEATLIDPNTGAARPGIVALVGLHIIHKTESQPTWFWATFEHKDNVKDAEDDQGPWNFYNPNCETQQVNVPANCGANTNSADSTYTVSCADNTPAPYHLCSGAGPVPMQASREIPIDREAQAVNKQLQAFINEKFPGSVWSNYQLINMIWSTTPQYVQPNTTPQGLKAMQPLIPMANTVAETFIQSATCFDCHQFAPIAPTATVSNPKFASDFSFVFEFANYPGKE